MNIFKKCDGKALQFHSRVSHNPFNVYLVIETHVIRVFSDSLGIESTKINNNNNNNILALLISISCVLGE